METTFASAESKNVGVVVDDFVWFFLKTSQDFLALLHAQSASCGTRGLHASDAVALPNNQRDHDLFHFCSNLVEVAVFSA